MKKVPVLLWMASLASSEQRASPDREPRLSFAFPNWFSKLVGLSIFRTTVNTGNVYAEEDEDKVVLFNGTRSAGKAQKEGMVSLKCGNLFNVNVFRELNKKLNGRVIPILCDDTMRSPLTRITEDHCR